MRTEVPVVIRLVGRAHQWDVFGKMTRGQIDGMREDGVVVGVVEYVIPNWVVALGMTRAWMLATDLIQFRNPRRRR